MLSLGDNQVVTAFCLRKKGYSYENLKGYIRNGYLHALGRGAYCKAGTHPTMEAAISAMAEQEGLPVHLGGRSALAKWGHFHFVPFAKMPAIVFLTQRRRLPAWFLHFYSGSYCICKTNFISSSLGIDILDGCPIATPERAILEFLYGVPQKQSVAEAYQILETMLTLRPNLLSSLLADCSSIKVKRLFFLLANDLNPPWWSKVKKDGIDLGTGCRVIDRDGSYCAEFNLVVKPWREI